MCFAEVIVCGVFRSVPGIRDYTVHTVLAPIVTVTKHTFIGPAWGRDGRPQLYFRK